MKYIHQFIHISVVAILLFSCEENLQTNGLDIKEKKNESTFEVHDSDQDSSVHNLSDSIIKPIKTKVISASDHSIFSNFWADFKAAVLSKDKEAVFKLTYLPFEDGNDIYTKAQSLTTKTKKQFLANYNKIFTRCTIKAVKNNKYHSWESCEDCMMGEPKLKGDYILSVQHNCSERGLQDIGFKKIKGKFMLHRIQYMP